MGVDLVRHSFALPAGGELAFVFGAAFGALPGFLRAFLHYGTFDELFCPIEI